MTELTQRRAAQEPELQAVIQVPHDPPRVLTAGYDHLAILWDFEGVRINVLAQSQTQVWNVGIFPGQTSSDEQRVRAVYAEVKRMEMEERRREQELAEKLAMPAQQALTA